MRRDDGYQPRIARRKDPSFTYDLKLTKSGAQRLAEVFKDHYISESVDSRATGQQRIAKGWFESVLKFFNYELEEQPELLQLLQCNKDRTESRD